MTRCRSGTRPTPARRSVPTPATPAPCESVVQLADGRVASASADRHGAGVGPGRPRHDDRYLHRPHRHRDLGGAAGRRSGGLRQSPMARCRCGTRPTPSPRSLPTPATPATCCRWCSWMTVGWPPPAGDDTVQIWDPANPAITARDLHRPHRQLCGRWCSWPTVWWPPPARDRHGADLGSGQPRHHDRHLHRPLPAACIRWCSWLTVGWPPPAPMATVQVWDPADP